MKKNLGFTMAVLMTLGATDANAAAGSAAADFLKVSPDSRSAALGNTGSADAANGFAAFLNPALPAAGAHKMLLSAGQTQWLLNSQVSHYAASFRREAAQGGAWAAAFTLSQWNLPSFQTTDSLGNSTGQASYGARSAGVSLSRSWGRFAAGAGVKQVNHGFQGGVSAKASFLAWDAGVYAQGEEGQWSAGAVAQNLGSGASLGNGTEKLSSTLRAGVEFRPGDKRFSWTAEASHSKDGGLSAAAGLGFSATKTLSLRGGYDGRIGGGDYAGLTSGVGLSFGSVTLDYAFSPFGQLGSVQRISATWAYGGARRTVREAASRRAVRAGSSRGVTGRGGEYKYTYRRPK